MTSRTADNLVECLLADTIPRRAALVDFGLDYDIRSRTWSRRYGILQDLVRKGTLDADALHQVAGDGPGLTKLTNQGVEFVTAFDDLPG